MKVQDWIRKIWSDRKVDKPVSADEFDDSDPNDPFPDPVEIPISDVFDLHTIPARDVKRVVEEYLQLAHEAGFRSVRIIHGKGIGVQRDMVRSILSRTRYVRDWTDAPPEAGGLGATIAHLNTLHEPRLTPSMPHI